MSRNLSELFGRKGLADNLFDRLGDSAVSKGSPDREDMDKLSEEFLTGKANTYGVTTYYDFMKPENKGKKVYICNGSACLCAGTQNDVRAKVKNHFQDSEIGEMTCLGRCHENSAFHLAGNNYSGDNINQLDKLIQTKSDKKDRYNTSHLGTAVLTREFSGIESQYAPLASILAKDRKEVLEEIKRSNIRGRGGAGFPMGFKLESCMNAESDTKFIICNADEGDPGAYSDRYLLEERPHAVLFGMIAAGYVIGAQWGVVYIRAEYPEAVRNIEAGIQQLRDHKLLGSNISGSGFDFDFKVIKAQGAYICGEETALINSIEGQRPVVRIRPPYPAREGLFNKPTVVSNVETLASLHYICSEGGEAYSALGKDKSTGTKLISLDSFFNTPGVYEVEMGTPLAEVISELGGGFISPVKAIQVGGPLGGVVPIHKINDLTVDFESFEKEGFLLGHASVVSIPEDFPMIRYIGHLFEFTSYESCGKCFPCRLGSKRAYELAQKAEHEGDKIDHNLMSDLLETLEQTSLCALGGGISLPVYNILEYFSDELKKYFDG